MPRSNDTIVNLCFHGIGTLRNEREPGESKYWINPDAFRAILDLAAERPNVALSFDDGNSSDIEIGLPELVARNLTATFFPIAGRLNRAGCLSGSDLSTLAREGMTIGSHGMHHRSWRGLTDPQQIAEFDTAREILQEASGHSVERAACPLGAYDRGVLRCLKQRGYRMVMTSDRARARAGSWLQARYSVQADDTAEGLRAIIENSPPLGETIRSEARILAKRMR